MKVLHTRLFRAAALVTLGALGLVTQRLMAQQGPTITTTAVPNGEVGLPYVYPDNQGFQFAATGGNVNRWQAVPDTSALPPGLDVFNDGSFGSTDGSGPEQPTVAGAYTFTVRVSCDCSTSDQRTFTMHVYAPLAIAGAATIPSATVGQAYQHVFVGQGGDPAAYRWSVFDEDSPFCGTSGVPPGMCLSQSGVLSGTPTTPGDYSFDLDLFGPINTAIGNTSGNNVQLQIRIHVDAAAPPQVNSLTLSGPLNLGTFILGTPVSAALTANGGNQPYTFQLTGLPAGMTANGAGISGTPTVPGNYGVGVTVTDSAHVTASSAIGFSVFGIVPVALPNAVTSSSYSYTFTAAGGTPPYTFSATGLPPHFSFGNGSLSGTPSATGNYTIAVTVTDENGHTYTGSYPLAITVPPPLKVPGGALSDITVLTPNSQNLSATGGAPGYSWSLAGGSLPDGIGLRPSGTLYGTPSKTGSYIFSARATDVTGASGVGSFSVNVTPTPVIVTTPSPLAAGMVNVDYPLQVLTASGGIGPYTFSVPANSLPAGLTLTPEGAISGTPATAGISSITVTATDSQKQTGTASLQIRVRPFAPDLALSAGSLAFSLATGATALPGSQSVQVEATDVTKILNYSTAVTSGSGPAATWLSVSPGGKTPGSFTVSLTAEALSLAASATPYQATITVTCLSPSPCAGNAQSVAVLLPVSNILPQLTVLTDLLSFTASSTNPQASAQTIVVQNSGGGGVGFSSVTCAPAWCKVSGVPGSIGAGVSGTITITADPTGLGAGYYYTDVTIVTSVGTTIVPVTYFLAPNASIGLSPAGVQLTMTVGGAAAVPDPTFAVNTVSSDSIAWSAAVLPGAPWLQLVASATGTATGAAPGSITYAIDQAAAAALVAGTYYGTIRVTSSGASNSPQDFQVVLDVTAVDKQKPNPSPAGLIFISSATPALPPQTVQVFASSVTPLIYQASVQTSDGGNWLSVTPTNGIASASAPGKATITAAPAGLKAGTYHGSVSYSFTASAVRTVNVTLIVQTAVPASVPGSTTGLTKRADPAPCTPTQLIPTQTGLVNNFAAPASWPAPLEIQLTSDCGLGIADAQVVATFSNGDPPLLLALSDTPTGKYSGTWTPRKTGPQVTIIAKATAPGFPAATTQIAGSVVPNVAPVLTRNSTLHIFNPQVGAPLAPGTIVQIYGSSLANQTLPGTTVPLATSLAGTSVIIGGIQAPLFFVSPGQVNAEIPFELTPGQPYQVVVNNNGALSTPDSIQSAVVAPGVAALPTGFANGQHVADGSVITDASPAKPGEYVVIYLAGLGPTTVPVASGAGAPTSPLAQTRDTPAVTLDTEPVTVLFSGLTPGLAGLYQIDLQIPADAPDGDLALVVNQPGVAGTSVILPVHH